MVDLGLSQKHTKMKFKKNLAPLSLIPKLVKSTGTSVQGAEGSNPSFPFRALKDIFFCFAVLKLD